MLGRRVRPQVEQRGLGLSGGIRSRSLGRIRTRKIERSDLAIEIADQHGRAHTRVLGHIAPNFGQRARARLLRQRQVRDEYIGRLGATETGHGELRAQAQALVKVAGVLRVSTGRGEYVGCVEQKQSKK